MSKRRRFLRGVAAVASAGALALTVAAGSATLAAETLEDNVTVIDISDQVGERVVDFGNLSSGPVTFLLMGSDARTGKGNKGYGYFDGARSDTTLLVHVYPKRDAATVVSIPRDTLVSLPRCRNSDGVSLGPYRGRFNEAFYRGGPGCTIKTVEALSGLEIDHFVVLDFNGFKRSIDALGGVEVCLTRPLEDPQSRVDLPAGRTRVSGEEALGFVRVRHNIGDGSDISRINRQQLFMSSLIQEVTSSGLLTDPLRVWRVLDESTKSIATNPELADSQGLIALAASLSGLRPKDITFITLPWLPSGDGATVVADSAKADVIWKALATNTPWPPPPTKGVDGKRLKRAPEKIRVDVHNATGDASETWSAANALGAQGFRINIANQRSKSVVNTTIVHNADQVEAARTLQAAIPNSIVKLDAGNGNTLDVTLGSTYDGIAAINVKKKSTSSSSDTTSPATAAQDICTG